MSKYSWLNLIQDYEASDLSQTQFCQERDINLKYFNSKYSQYRKNKSSTTTFVKAELETSKSVTNLSIQVGRCTVICPESMPIQSFVSLVHQLA